MYSLVSAGILALDLARHPAGAGVADVTERVLLLEPGELAALADAAAAVPGIQEARRRLLGVAAQAPTMAQTLSAVTRSLAGEPAELPQTSALLAARLVGGLPDLHALLLGEAPLADPEVATKAIGACLDAVTAAWVASAPGVDDADVELLRTPWRAAVPAFPSTLPAAVPGGSTQALLDLLDRVARCSATQWRDLDAAHEASYDGLGWSALVHEGCRAAVAADRTLDVARWQLAAARTAHTTGHAVTVCAPGAMMSVVAAVQAACARDLLAPDDVAVMTGPCRAVLGWSG